MNDRHVIERKFTTALSYRVSIKTLRRIKQEASETNKTPVLVMEFSGHFYYPPEKWACIPFEEWQRLKAR